LPSSEAHFDVFWPQDIRGSVVVDSGDILMREVLAPVLLRVLKGSINLQKNQGNMQIFSQKGSVSILEHSGDLEVESFSANISIKQTKGRLELKNFAGESFIENQIGRTIIESYSGGQKLNNSKGSLYFSMGRGPLSVSAFVGRIEGENKEATILLAPKEEVEVDVHSAAGKVIVNLPTASGAYLNLSTVSGELVPLLPVKSYREDKYKMAKGRVKGDPRGHFNFRGDEVSIIVR
jgi:DUF4097 and DUF4098 domain-containing protein YvlB